MPVASISASLVACQAIGAGGVGKGGIGNDPNVGITQTEKVRGGDFSAANIVDIGKGDAIAGYLPEQDDIGSLLIGLQQLRLSIRAWSLRARCRPRAAH